MKTILAGLVLCLLMAVNINVSFASDVTEKAPTEQTLFAEAATPVVDYGTNTVLYADASTTVEKEEANQKVTPQDISNIIDEKLQPVLDEVSDLLEDAPGKEEPKSTKVNYWLFGVINLALFGFGLFAAGSKENRFSNFKTS